MVKVLISSERRGPAESKIEINFDNVKSFIKNLSSRFEIDIGSIIKLASRVSIDHINISLSKNRMDLYIIKSHRNDHVYLYFRASDEKVVDEIKMYIPLEFFDEHSGMEMGGV